VASAKPVPVLLSPGTPVTDAFALSTGSYAFYTCMLRVSDGSPWCWGDNEYGQLGDGTFIVRPNPVEATVFPALP
jgi:alpha-tubulin suppressor-like RCC1 family protein